MAYPGSVLQSLQARKAEARPAFAVLADPDKAGPETMPDLARRCSRAGVDLLLMGGSLVVKDVIGECIRQFKAHSDIPVLLFPGSPAQLTPEADALLYLSLVSGRNPDLLIGQHVVSAPAVRASGLEVLSTGYMVVDGGAPTTVSYISGSLPLPANKPDIALCTAWAAELQGKHILYLDAGSGAKNPVPEAMIRTIAGNTGLPLFVGGGIRTPERAAAAAQAGATVIVVGNALESAPELMEELVAAVRSAQRTAA